MKRLLLCVVVACCSLSFYSESSPDILVGKIRIFIDQAEYLWTQSALERLDDQVISPPIQVETVISFLSIQPGRYTSEEDVASEAEVSQRRLRETGYFYEASIMIIPPKKVLHERTLVINVTTGFLTRFGGGGIWAMYGKVAMGGRRDALYLYAGYNKSGIRYLQSHVGGSPVILGGSLFYVGPGDYPGKSDGQDVENRFAASITTGWAITPDLSIGIEPTVEGFGFSSGGLLSVQPFISQRILVQTGHQSEGGVNLRLFWYPEHTGVKGEGSVYARLGITKRLTFAVKGSGGYSSTKIPEEALFDLYYTEDANVRSGYSQQELRAADYVLASAEVRFTVLETYIPPILNCVVQPFVFVDASQTLSSTKVGDKDFFDAYGLGVRVLLNNPVFAYFTFSYGVNNEGDGRFLFCGTAGY